jgi:hypothetical protein
LNEEYVKAMSARNTEMVYAQQVFCEPGMLPGFHFTRMYDELEIIPDSGWIVWFPERGALYDTMSNQEFQKYYVLYADMPKALQTICDARPDYNEWLDALDAQDTIPEADCGKNIKIFEDKSHERRQ